MLYGNSTDFYTLRDDRSIDIVFDDEKTVSGYGGDMKRIKSRMVEKGVKTYMLLHSHKCEHRGCGKQSDTKYCAMHMNPRLDPIFCLFGGFAMVTEEEDNAIRYVDESSQSQGEVV